MIEIVPTRLIVPLALSLSLAGCLVPWKFSGYRPTGPGLLVDIACVAGARDTLLIDAPNGVSILLRASDDSREATIDPNVIFKIPDGVSLQLLSPAVSIQSPKWTEPRSLVISGITAPGPRHYPPLAVLPGSSHESMGMFSLWFEPSGMPKVSRFAVSLPAMIINGHSFHVGEVTFDAYTEWGVYTCAQ